MCEENIVLGTELIIGNKIGEANSGPREDTVYVIGRTSSYPAKLFVIVCIKSVYLSEDPRSPWI